MAGFCRNWQSVGRVRREFGRSDARPTPANFGPKLAPSCRPEFGTNRPQSGRGWPNSADAARNRANFARFRVKLARRWKAHNSEKARLPTAAPARHSTLRAGDATRKRAPRPGADPPRPPSTSAVVKHAWYGEDRNNGHERNELATGGDLETHRVRRRRRRQRSCRRLNARPQDFGSIVPKFGRPRPEVGRSRPNFGRSRPCIQPTFSDFGKHQPSSGRNRTACVKMARQSFRNAYRPMQPALAHRHSEKWPRNPRLGFAPPSHQSQQ